MRQYILPTLGPTRGEPNHLHIEGPRDGPVTEYTRQHKGRAHWTGQEPRPTGAPKQRGPPLPICLCDPWLTKRYLHQLCIKEEKALQQGLENSFILAMQETKVPARAHGTVKKEAL